MGRRWECLIQSFAIPSLDNQRLPRRRQHLPLQRSVHDPSWYGSFIGGSSCPGGSTSTRYGIYAGCVLLGTNTNGLRYETTSFSISMAIPTYEAPSFMTQIIPTATFAVLVVSTGVLFMAWP